MPSAMRRARGARRAPSRSAAELRTPASDGAEAKRRKTSFSAVVTELVEREPATLPCAGLIADDDGLSLKVEEVLSRLDR